MLFEFARLFATTTQMLWVFAAIESATAPVTVSYTSDLYGVACAMFACGARCLELVFNQGMSWKQLGVQVLMASIVGFIAHMAAVHYMKITEPRVVLSICLASGLVGTAIIPILMDKVLPGYSQLWKNQQSPPSNVK